MHTRTQCLIKVAATLAPQVNVGKTCNICDTLTSSKILRAGMERVPEEGGGAVMMVTPKASPTTACLILGSIPSKSAAVTMPPAALHHKRFQYMPGYAI